MRAGIGWGGAAACAMFVVLTASPAGGRAQNADAEAPAQAVSPAPEREPTSPGTMTLDRMDPRTRFGVQIGVDRVDQTTSDTLIARVEPFVSYRIPGRRAGLYAQIPFTHGFNFNAGDATGAGNLDLGGFLLPNGDGSLMLRFGLVMPTASRATDRVVGNILGSFERTTDIVLVLPDYTTGRLSGSTLYENDRVFLRVDLGLDLVVDKPSTGNRTFLRVNVAGGVHTSEMDVGFEFVNFGSLDGSGSADERFLHTIAVALRTRGVDQFHVGGVLPLDDGARGEIWIVSLGYQRVID